MSIPNRFTFDQIPEVEAMALAQGKPFILTPPNIIDLQDDLVARAERLKLDKALLDRLMAEQHGKTAADRYAAEKKDSGKVTAPLDTEFDLVMERKKTVTWDQDLLGALATRIKDGGEDPAVYIVTTSEMTVKEAAYDAWPKPVQEEFLPARTVKVADTKFLVQPKKKAK